MKKLLLGSVALVALIAAGAANAADLPVKAPLYKAPPPPVENYIVESNNQIIAEFVDTYLNYEEYGGDYGTPTGPLDTEKGWVPGFGVKLSVMRNWWFQNAYFEAEFTRDHGSTNYTGGLIGVPACGFGCIHATDGATFTDFHNRFGKGFELQPNVMLTPYLEWGYHQWNRVVNSGETYDNYYFGAGGLLQYSPFARTVISVNGMLGSTLGSFIVVNPIPAGPPGFSAALGNSFTYNVGGALDYGITRNVHVNVGIDYTSFKYEATALQPGTFFEPHSTTGITTLKVGVGYAF